MQDVVAGTLFFLLLSYGCTAVAVPFVERMLPAREGPMLRILAIATISSFHLTLLFHLLLAFSAFDRLTASIVLAVEIAVVRLAGFGHRAMGDRIRRDLDAVFRLATTGRFTGPRLVYLSAGLFAVVTAARALMLPTVGWDSLTYHFVKAGMWVQTGGPITLTAPGGWGMYRSIFGGGEIFTAWAMLPFHNDLLACAVDLVWWALLGIALYALCLELGLRARHRSAVVVYALFLPATWDAVGWGYVDLTNAALSLTGLVFALRYLRVWRSSLLLLAMLALGLASGVKLTSVPFLAATGLILLASVARDRASNRAERGRRIGYLLLGGLGGILCVGPWLLGNLLDTGYPLRIPATIAGFQLGADNPTFAWYQDRDITPYTFATEWAALRALFPLPNVNESHLSVFSLLPLALAPIGFGRLFRSKRASRTGLALLLCLVAATFLFFYSPSFSFSRLEFTWVNGRFLLPVLLVCLPLAFAALPNTGRARDLLGASLLVGTVVHLGFFGPVRLTTPSVDVVAVGTAVVLAAVALLVLMQRLPAGAQRTAVPALVFAVVVGLFQLRETERRYELLDNRNVVADIFRYWWVAARIVDEEPGPVRLAVTAGDRQDADNWLMYYFMGRDLQNSLHYVPISTSGAIVPFGPESRREQDGNADAWRARLRQHEITHVMSFFPTSVELGWMSEDKRTFERLTGYEDHWALFRVLPLQ